MSGTSEGRDEAGAAAGEFAPNVEGDVTRRALTMDCVLLSSKRRFAKGEAVVVHLITEKPGQRVCITGKVARCRKASNGSGYLLRVRLTEVQGILKGLDKETADHRAVTPAVPVAAVPDAPLQDAPTSHMLGSLEEINVPNLLTFLDRERRSATVQLSFEGDEQVSLFVRDGRLVDVTGLQADTGIEERRLLYDLFDRASGEFELEFMRVTNADRFNISTQTLLLDYAVSRNG